MIETALLAVTTPKNEESGGSVAEVGLCTWCHWGTGALRPVGLNTMMTTAMLQFYSKKAFGTLSTCKESEGGGNASDSFHYLFCFHYIVQPFPLVEPVFLFLLTHFKESGGAFVSDSLVSRSGQSSPFFLRHHVTSSSQDVLSGTPHRSDGVCERVEDNGALLTCSRSSKDFRVGGGLDRKKSQSVLNPYEYWWS